ncbi:hypothetical protein OBV_p-00460 (plasmid) [Oscillibacter valericigenes Sjm18-20]|nr:hypothetical protein OBV_p-00460 [Oscillibacter valericigenes Sjm18-20]
MSFFERRYKAAALSELERCVRDLEEREKAVEQMPKFDTDLNEVSTNIKLLERIELVSAIQAQAFRDRLVKAHQEYARMVRETHDIVNDYENPRERATRFQNMERYNSQIVRERAASSERHTPEYPAPDKDDERTR